MTRPRLPQGPRPRTEWGPVLKRARDIVLSYDTGVTLRQLHYRLVAAELIPNTRSAYKTLSDRTAAARRRGEFPDLIDRGRRIERAMAFDSPEDARSWLRDVYRRDRTEGQEHAVYIGIEKAALLELLSDWFEDRGIPLLALGGYPSQTLVSEVVAEVEEGGRPALLLYAGDFDPSGEDIDRDFVARAGCFTKALRIALNADQVEEYGLPPAMGKSTDSRARAFTARHGDLVQVELDALPPEVLQNLFEEALQDFWDVSTYEAVVAREDEERERL